MAGDDEEQATARRKVLGKLMRELLAMEGDAADLETRLADWKQRWLAAYRQADDALDADPPTGP